MDRRTTTRKVSFSHSFWLNGMDQPQPAGTYTVTTEQEALDTLSVAGWRHVATSLQLFRYGATEHLGIDPVELHEALQRDGVAPSAPQQDAKARP